MKTPFSVGDFIICDCGECSGVKEIIDIRKDVIECADGGTFSIEFDSDTLRKATKLELALK